MQNKDNIIFASDTAVSMSNGETSFRVDNVTKLSEHEDYIMFCSGKMWIRDLLLSKLKYSTSIGELHSILKSEILPICKEMDLEVIVAKKDVSELVMLSSYDEFNFNFSKSTDDLNLFVVGKNTDETSLLFEKKFNGHVINSLQNTYEEISCPEIGGKLDVWILTNDNLDKRVIEIDKLQLMDEIEAYKRLELVIADRLVGRVILGNKLVIESNSGITQLNGDTITIKDNLGNLKLQAGKYTDPNNASQFKYGLYIPNGSIDIRSTSTPNRGIQMDDEGYRAFNSNGVRTFDVNAQTGLVSIVGSLSIKTTSDTNRGVVFDGNGISAYNLSGSRTFYVDTNGNVTANNGNFTGIINATGGTISGDLTVTGTLTGGSFNSGSFNSGTFNAGVINGTTINSSELYSAYISAGTITGTSINSTNITGSTIRGNEIIGGDIRGATVTAGTINGTTINGVTINSADIDIMQNVKIGNDLYLRGDANAIIFGEGSRLISYNGTLELTSVGSISLQSSTGINVFTDVLDLSNATQIIGVPKSYTSGLGIAYSSGANRLYVRIDGVDQGWVALSTG